MNKQSAIVTEKIVLDKQPLSTFVPFRCFENSFKMY